MIDYKLERGQGIRASAGKKDLGVDCPNRERFPCKQGQSYLNVGRQGSGSGPYNSKLSKIKVRQKEMIKRMHMLKNPKY